MNFKNIQWLRNSAEFKQLLTEGVSTHIHQNKGFCCWLLIFDNSVPDKVLQEFYVFAYNACSQTSYNKTGIENGECLDSIDIMETYNLKILSMH